MDDYSRMFDLTGRRALVIGGASGIGRASCFGLSSFGAQVICGDLAIDQAKETAQVIAAGGRSAEALPIDLCDGASVAAAAAAVGAARLRFSTPLSATILPSLRLGLRTSRGGATSAIRRRW